MYLIHAMETGYMMGKRGGETRDCPGVAWSGLGPWRQPTAWLTPAHTQKPPVTTSSWSMLVEKEKDSCNTVNVTSSISLNSV